MDSHYRRPSHRNNCALENGQQSIFLSKKKIIIIIIRDTQNQRGHDCITQTPPPSATSTRIRSTSAGLRSARTSAACGARPGRWIRLSCGMYLESRFGYAPPAGIKTPKRSDYALGFTDRNSIVKEILRKIKSIDPSHRGRHEAPFS